MTTKYVLRYELPYTHRVMVGIEANDRDEAIAKAEALFDQGDIWQDSDEAPLLFDDFEEEGSTPLIFTVEEEINNGPWPKPDASVLAIRQRYAASRAAWLLVEAYRNGEEAGGSVDWSDLDCAHDAAKRAVENIAKSTVSK